MSKEEFDYHNNPWPYVAEADTEEYQWLLL